MRKPTGRSLQILLVPAACCCVLSGCGLVKMPFRVAGAVVDTAYEGGKKVVDTTSDALEKRKQKKQQEEAEAAKTDARTKSQAKKPEEPQGKLLPPDGVPTQQGPAIPVDDQPLPPVEPLPLPQ